MIFSVFTAKADGMHMYAAKGCCHDMMKNKPCGHQQKNDCGLGMCSSMLSCNSCGFLKADAVSVTPVVPTQKEPSVTPHHLGSLSAYSLSCWRPPKV